MAERKTIIGIGVVTEVYRQDETIPGAEPIWIALCEDAMGDYEPFQIVIPRLVRRTRNLFVEYT
jgi:hypothetical protein